MKTKGPCNETQLPFSFTTHLDRVIDVFFSSFQVYIRNEWLHIVHNPSTTYPW